MVSPFPILLSFQLLHLHLFILMSTVFASTWLCIQALPNCTPFFSPGPLMQKRIFLKCVCLHSQEFLCWHAIQWLHSCPNGERVSSEGDLEATWVLRSLFAPCYLAWSAARRSCAGIFASCLQASVKTLSGWEGRMDVGVLVDDTAVWM